MIATAAEGYRVIGAPGGSHARDCGGNVGIVPPPPHIAHRDGKVGDLRDVGRDGGIRGGGGWGRDDGGGG